MVLSQVDCFIQCEVLSSQISLDGVLFNHVMRGCPCGLLQFSDGGAVRRLSQHLCRHPYMQYAQTNKDAVTGLLL